jgi:hypothetical protein
MMYRRARCPFSCQHSSEVIASKLKIKKRKLKYGLLLRDTYSSPRR